MKKFFIFSLVALSALLLSSCCMLGHTWQDANCTEAQTCLNCGKIEGEPLGHVWQEATCTEPKTCKACGESQGEMLGHTWKEANCLEPETCLTCGSSVGTPVGHVWKEATCTEPRTCTVCKEITGVKKGHSWTNATCETPTTCRNCGKKQGQSLGHAWQDATCARPKTCASCGKTVGDTLNHTWKSATCTAPKTCSACRETFGKPLGHTTETGICERCEENFSNWGFFEFVDKFQEPMGIFFLFQETYGVFSNSATTNSELIGAIYVAERGISIRLWEYGSNQVKGNLYNETFEFTIQETGGKKTTLTGKMEEGDEDIFFNKTNEKKLMDILKKEQPFKVYIENNDYGFSSYLFEVDPKGFNEMYKLLEKTFN